MYFILEILQTTYLHLFDQVAFAFAKSCNLVVTAHPQTIYTYLMVNLYGVIIYAQVQVREPCVWPIPLNQQFQKKSLSSALTVVPRHLKVVVVIACTFRST